MIITAESGASKTDWVIDGRHIRTKGINFSVMTYDDISSIVACVANEIREGLSIGITHNIPVCVNFYGAGLVSEEQKARMSEILEDFFPGSLIECSSDLLAAARALWGDGPGTVAILGTGSNSCSYNGRRITGNIRPGGYILGDEGGGAALGRQFLSDYIKDLVPERIAAKFREQYPLRYQDIINSVYKSSNPAGFLASFAPFIIELASRDSYCGRILDGNLRAFVTRSLLPYRHAGEVLDVGVVGSVGLACSTWLQKIGDEYGIRFCKFISTPIESLADYHLRKNPNFAPGFQADGRNHF